MSLYTIALAATALVVGTFTVVALLSLALAPTADDALAELDDDMGEAA